jgi:hypothetical protein
MDRFPLGYEGAMDWRPGSLDLRFDRVVTAIEGQTITLDAPLTTALDAALGGGTVVAYAWPGRIGRVGVENLRCESEFDRANPLDEQHAWDAIALDAAQDAWVRRVTAAHFAGSAVRLLEGCKGVTVQDCRSVEPISEVGGYRRHTYFTGGQLTLFRRCRSEHGRHDFAVGAAAAGPNAFAECEATAALGDSGPIESWASGVLYDNVTIDGGGLSLTNREVEGQGVGWAAANGVLWQCSAPIITCRNPPGARNWAIGCWGQFVGDGLWQAPNEFVTPASLYRAQLAERLGDEAVGALEPRAIPTAAGDAVRLDGVSPGREPGADGEARPLAIRGGWIACDGKLLVGGRTGTTWWRGSVLPSRAAEFGPGVTRFVPGRDGPGFTDDLDQLTDAMRRGGQAVLAHHWGLWYDRRRDDHQMVRRIDGGVWPPFYEQPWARSGRGTAWDGLSRYDLTAFNPWYFGRLAQVRRAVRPQGAGPDPPGLLPAQHPRSRRPLGRLPLAAGQLPPGDRLPRAAALRGQEAGVHGRGVLRRDAPAAPRAAPALHPQVPRHARRPPERDLRHGRGVHRAPGVRPVLDRHDRRMGAETGKDVRIGLSCTKDVQDAILADPDRGPAVSVIEMKYWWYPPTGPCTPPKGARTSPPGSSGARGRATRESRARRPPVRCANIAIAIPGRRSSAPTHSTRPTPGPSSPRAARSRACLPGPTRVCWRPCRTCAPSRRRR